MSFRMPEITPEIAQYYGLPIIGVMFGFVSEQVILILGRRYLESRNANAESYSNFVEHSPKIATMLTIAVLGLLASYISGEFSFINHENAPSTLISIFSTYVSCRISANLSKLQ